MFLFPVVDMGFQMTWKQEDLKAGGRNVGVDDLRVCQT